MPKNAKVLIVEDVADTCELLVFAFKRHGYEAVCVAEGESALTEFKKSFYDLVIMDCALPVMSGPETAKLMRAFEAEKSCAGEARRRSVIVAFTAYGVDAINIIDRIHFDGVFYKPADASVMPRAALDLVKAVQSEREKAGTLNVS